MIPEIRLAQIGCGHWGKNLARNFAELGALAAVADASPETGARIAAQHDVPLRSFDDILSDDRITAVALATPAPSHGEMGLRAIAAGKHVFIEKPLALNPIEGERLVAAAVQAGRTLMIGHLLNYHPIFAALKAIVGRGDLGQLRYIYSNRLSLGKLRVEENVLWSFAPHDISMLLALAGEEPSHVSAEGASWVTPGIADWASTALRFPSGLRGHVQVSWVHPTKEQRLVVIGDHGMAVFEDSDPDWGRRLAVYRHEIDRRDTVPKAAKVDPEYIVVPDAEPLREECRHFLDCIRTGTAVLTDGREGLRVLRVLDRAEQSLAASLGGSA